MPITPGSEAALALAMANVLREPSGADPAGLAVARSRPTRRRWPRRKPACRPRRSSGSRASSRRPDPSLAVAGGVGSAARRRAPSCAPRSTSSTSWRATSARRCASAPTSPPADGYAALGRAGAGMDAGEVAVVLVHDANPAYTLPRASGFAEAFAKVGFKVSTSMYLDETAALCDLLLPQHHALERWDDLRPRAGVLRADAAGDGAGVQHPAGGRHPAADGQEGRRRAGAVHCALVRGHLKTRWQALAARAGRRGLRRRSGTGRCSAAACIARRRRRLGVASLLSAARVALHQARLRGGWRLRLR